MAFNWPTFRTRAITAVVFVVIMALGLLWDHWSFFVLFTVIHFGCWWEYLSLLEKIHVTRFHIYARFGFMLMGYAIFLAFCGDVFHLGVYILRHNFTLPVAAAGFVMILLGIFQKQPVSLKSFSAAIAGLLYISLSWGMMMGLRSAETFYMPGKDNFYDKGWILPCIIIGAIWINDTMAYIVGSLIGKTPFSKISPKKTWEGTGGGALLSVAVFTVIAWQQREYAHGYIHRIDIICIAAIAAVTGTAGDLLESKLKRMAGVKDSGHLMPGHGGFLDRFDSLLLAVPFVWLYARVFMQR